MNLAVDDTLVGSATPRRIETVILPNEGDDGLYTQTWYPICASEEIPVGTARSFQFLGGRVVAYRGQDGIARVMSGYCPHIGADLGDAAVIDNGLQCPWHKFEFDMAGFCVKTGVGDPAPRSARLFAFPTEDKFGLIWAFNGDAPLFDIPGFPADKPDLVFVTKGHPVDFGIEPWRMLGQTPDISHFATLHNIVFADPQPWDTVKWGPFSFSYDIVGERDGIPVKFHQEIWGTNILLIYGEVFGRWYGWLAPAALPEPGRNQAFSVLAAERFGDEEAALRFIDDVEAFNIMLAHEDIPITQRMSFRVGTLTKSDRELHRYYHDYVRNYPRTVPAGGLLR